ncbi:hypothetical protein NDU88_001159 [Pleurodeles waltl]|uniref:Indolethylamine N-methyltransferase n=1 Tax=Pleurodeles waltl TaxID=8319 RepID=A0AAV7VB01_PLEWA|nr:hypothetical protein NDU88_001159 [Pleurodeles waltl]
MASAFTDKEIYSREFNPRAYVETYFAENRGALVIDEYLSFVLKQLFKIFSAGIVRGDTLIDIGTGPTIYQLLSACEVFKEIIVTDYCEDNRQEFGKWLTNEPGHFDWSPIVRFVCELEGKRDKSTEKEEKLRQKVKQVLKCDVTKGYPLEPLVLPTADCLLSALCLEGACKDQETFRDALKNISSLLKIGGHLVMMGVLEETFYMVGHYKFSCLFLDVEFVRNAVIDAGYTITDFQTSPRPENANHSLSDYKGYFFVVAHKVKDV